MAGYGSCPPCACHATMDRFRFRGMIRRNVPWIEQVAGRPPRRTRSAVLEGGMPCIRPKTTGCCGDRRPRVKATRKVPGLRSVAFFHFLPVECRDFARHDPDLQDRVENPARQGQCATAHTPAAREGPQRLTGWRGTPSASAARSAAGRAPASPRARSGSRPPAPVQTAAARAPPTVRRRFRPVRPPARRPAR
jgi:hypothetical protein